MKKIFYNPTNRLNNKKTQAFQKKVEKDKPNLILHVICIDKSKCNGQKFDWYTVSHRNYYQVFRLSVQRPKLKSIIMTRMMERYTILSAV